LIIEKNAAAAIDLDIDKTRRKNRVVRQRDSAAYSRVSGPDTFDQAVRHRNQCRSLHNRSVEQLRRSNRELCREPGCVHDMLIAYLSGITNLALKKRSRTD